MSQIYLQEMVRALPPEDIPANWTDFDLGSFSANKHLYDYQQDALKYALRALWRYYAVPTANATDPAGFADARKASYWQWYQDAGLSSNLDLSLNQRSKSGREQASLLAAYYPLPDNNATLDFQHLVNRMSFWMATGSGKTLALVKLVELLYILMKRQEIPTQDILILTHREDLLAQIRQHIAEYNQHGGGVGERPYLRLHELKAYADVKHSHPSLLRGHELNLFAYRADNLSDVQKERIIDFRNYENNGQWYVLLDEAHRGDREESKRQHIFSILSRHGFLFNFSATFTDPRDIATTVANYNLREFISAGRGKQIAILQQNVRQFRKGQEDFSDTEKQTIVLKALLLLASIRQIADEAQQIEAALYHRPLLMTLVNSVNTQDADLKLFFRQLASIGREPIPADIWEQAKADLRQELTGQMAYLFTGEKAQLDPARLEQMTQEGLLQAVFNAPGRGEIEVLVRPSNRQEVAFKLKTAVDPFALIRIGDISDWLKNELAGYQINERYADESYFLRLNQPNSPINILLGSRSFYEGWDSNRPNVIMYINIGTSSDAQKFILQSVGRGVRIEPLPGQRQRLRQLKLAGKVDQGIFDQVKALAAPLESVFVFGTSATVLEQVLLTMEKASGGTVEQTLSLEVNEAAEGKLLLIPVYRDRQQRSKRPQTKFPLTQIDQAWLSGYLNHVADDRVLLALHNVTPQQIVDLRTAVADPAGYFNAKDARPYKEIGVLLRQFLAYQTLIPQEWQGVKSLDEEIRHFRHIRVLLQDISQLQNKINDVLAAPKRLAEARAKYEAKQLSFDELVEIARQTGDEKAVFTLPGKADLRIRRVANHYYIPLLISAQDKIDYIRSVIQHPSEKRFLEALETYLKTNDPVPQQFDWWLFSRIDEHQDEIGIPYYSPTANRIAQFRPDFIFWFQKGNQYTILFVDPKGTAHSDYQHKLDGYEELFMDNGAVRILPHKDPNGADLQVRVKVIMYTDNKAKVSDKYQHYWADSIQALLQSV
jgi:type III restriction enzyme